MALSKLFIPNIPISTLRLWTGLAMTEVLAGDALLELAKAKELASVMGGAWHAFEEDADSDSEQMAPKV